MGTRTDLRRRRARRRGLATFVSFLLLFAFALGQSSLIALADDAGTDPVADETVADGSTSDGLPASEEPPAEEPPAEEPPAEEPPAEEPPAEEPPAEEPPTDSSGGDSDASSDGGAASASSDGTESSKGNARDARNAALAGDDAVIQSHGGLHGGDIDLDYVAAGPLTYNHATGLGTYPTFGYNDRTISNTAGVVESLEAEDFECGDLVTFFTEVTVDDSADGEGTIELDYAFGAETTGQPGLGFSDIISVALNTPDDGNMNLDGDEVVTLVSETPDPAGDQQGYDQVLGTVEIQGLDPGDVVIVRLIAELTCFPGDEPTGNILNTIESGRVTSSDDDTIPVGQQTVPMKTGGFVAAPAIDITKTCPETPAVEGDEITFDITITNNGNEDLENLVVTDTVNGHAPVQIVLTPSQTMLAAGATLLLEFTYTVQAGDPDPLPNTVTVTADGAFSQTEVTDTDECLTDLEQNPEITVTKSCPGTAQIGDVITYTITVTNSGDETLEDVTVVDTLLGDLSGSFSDTFAPGQSESDDFPYEVQADDPDPLPNVVTATGTGATSSDEVSDTANCDTDILHPAIDVVKDCPDFGAVGEDLTYTITVTNTGDEDLENLVVMDTVNGHAAVQVPGPTTLDAGASVILEFVYTVQEGDPDPLPNTVTVTATGVSSEAEVSDTFECETDLINPAIAIVKLVNGEDEVTVPAGTTVTYTYEVTNTGDTTLFEVTVDDDILGHIGDIPVLEPGQSVTLTKDFVVGEDPVTNVATAEGEDVLGRTVSDDDDALVTPILAETPPPTPFTGSDAAVLGIIAMGLLGLGATLVAATRRRRARETA